jgi:hypothetical protein
MCPFTQVLLLNGSTHIEHCRAFVLHLTELHDGLPETQVLLGVYAEQELSEVVAADLNVGFIHGNGSD